MCFRDSKNWSNMLRLDCSAENHSFRNDVLFFHLLKVTSPVPEIPQELYNKPFVSCFIPTPNTVLFAEYLALPAEHKWGKNPGRLVHWWHCEATECWFLHLVALPSLPGQHALIPLSRQTCWAGVRLITTWHLFCPHHTPSTQQESAQSSRHDQATALGVPNLAVERCTTCAMSCPLFSRRHYREDSYFHSAPRF